MIIFNECSLIQLNRLRKEINRLLSKGISNIYLKDTLEIKWRTQNFDFTSLKRLFKVSFWGAATHVGIIESSNFLLQPKNQRTESKNVYGFSIIFILKAL